jgi:hypothetical protein
MFIKFAIILAIIVLIVGWLLAGFKKKSDEKMDEILKRESSWFI